MLKKVILLLLVLCCVVGLSSCGINGIKSSVKNHKPEDIAEKYISAYCNGEVEKVFECCVYDIDFETVVIEQANSLSKNEEFNDECFDAVENKENKSNEEIIREAFDIYAKLTKQYYKYNSLTIVGKDFLDLENSRECVEENNDYINNILTKDYRDSWEKKVYSQFIVDPNSIDSFCRVTVSIDFNVEVEEETIQLSVCLVEIDDCWKIYPDELDYIETDENEYGDVNFFSSFIYRGDPL